MPRLVLGDPFEDLVGRRHQAEDPPVARQAGDVLGIEHQAPAGRDHQPILDCQLGGELALDLPERILAAGPEDLGDLAVALLDQLIGVDELVAQLFGEQTTDGGLAGAHEAGEHNVAGVRRTHRCGQVRVDAL